MAMEQEQFKFTFELLKNYKLRERIILTTYITDSKYIFIRGGNVNLIQVIHVSTDFNFVRNINLHRI